MINISETLLNSYCEWVWYNVSKNTSVAPKVVLPRDRIPDDDNLKYYLMYQSQQFNQMCLMKFNELFLPEDYITEQKNDLEKTMFPYYILIVSLGLLGNFLSTCVFFGTKLRYSSPSVYLGAFALSDNCYLITTIARRSFNLNNLFFKTFSVFLINFCACLSAWLVIVLTVERYVAIKWPHLSKSFCTVARAKIMIIILTILTFFVNILEFLFLNIRVGSAIYKICQTVIVNIAPLIMIGILNILITYNIYKSSCNRRNLTANSITSNENRNDHNWISQTTIFLVSFAFMCSNVPYCITKTSFDFFRVNEVTNNYIKNTNEVNVHTSVFYTLATMRRKQALKKLICWGVITIHIYYTNFCINFFLYCVSGKNFRKRLVDVFKKSGNQLQNFYITITNR